jgi:Mg-chelatase subunit ChlI
LTHDSGGLVDGHEGDIVLRARLAAAMPADLPTSVVDFACHLAAGLGAEGLRGDVVLCRAAAALAGWEGRSITTEDDVERVAPLALGHRRRRRPFHAPALAPGELERALASAREAFVVASNGEAAAGGQGEAAAGGQGEGDEPGADGDPATTASDTATTDTSDASKESGPDESGPVEDTRGESEAGARGEPPSGDGGVAEDHRPPATSSGEPAAQGS